MTRAQEFLKSFRTLVSLYVAGEAAWLEFWPGPVLSAAGG